MRSSYLLPLYRHARRLSAVSHQCRVRDLFHRKERAGGYKADEPWTRQGRIATPLPLASYFRAKEGGLSVNSPSVNILLQKMMISVTVFSLVFSGAAVAQVLPPAEKAARVEISQAPALELAHGDLAIIRWATNNPGGSDDHFGVVYYGTDLK